MPQMYKLGESKYFRTLEEGLAQNYYESFNAFRASIVGGKPAPATIPIKMSREAVLARAERAGLDVSIHHHTLRKQVEALDNEEIGSDQPSLRTDQG